MEHHVIYRYEDAEGVGPYQSKIINNFIWQLVDTHHCRFETHPSIKDDWNHIISVNFEYFCACPSIKLLKRWFKGFNNGLPENGFKMVEYTVKDIIPSLSGRQLFFHPDNVISKRILN